MGLESSLAGRPLHVHWPLFITGLIVRREPGAYRGQSCSQSSSEFKKLLPRKCYRGQVQSLPFFDQKWLKSYLESLVRDGQSLQSNCWYARDVKAALSVVSRKKSISLLWERNSVFMQILRAKIILYWPPTWPPCHVVANQ